ncbi:gp450 [Bacillus phage G]|uniref:Gp450 n=1 Tax=Bacillus phage G TaxID=2884420 RepID=G3MAJ1_9CAUD|nr:gp450 [Bacillus phage G]AEO93708.1 gp450 [Bacillus phage G]
MYEFGDLKINATKGQVEKLDDIKSVSDSITTSLVYRSTDKLVFLVKVAKNNHKYTFFMTLREDEIMKISFEQPQYTDKKLLFSQLSHVMFEHLIIVADSLYLSQDEQCNDKLKAIICQDSCPICDSKLENNNDFSVTLKSCANNCYEINKSFNKMLFQLMIFDNLYINNTVTSLQQRIEFVDKVYDEILYWKNGERYLVKLLSK